MDRIGGLFLSISCVLSNLCALEQDKLMSGNECNATFTLLFSCIPTKPKAIRNPEPMACNPTNGSDDGSCAELTEPYPNSYPS